jgi:Tfp pilus assembly protein PilP
MVAVWLVAAALAPGARATVTNIADAETPPAAVPAAPGSAPSEASPPYNSTGKRDPFQPQAQSTGPPSLGTARTPLQQFELSQLRLVAIITDASDPKGGRAVVEDSAGLGYIVRVETPIGRNDGRVTAIDRDHITIEEWPVNVFGERRRTVIVKELDAVEEEAKR